MGSDKIKIRYVRWRRTAWVWSPVRKMLAAGFRPVRLSAGYVVDGKRYPSAADIETATRLNQEWDRHRRGLPPLAPRPRYPAGSIGDGYDRAMALREKERKAKGVVWTNEQHSRDDWPRAWRWIEPLFGDADPKLVTPEQALEMRSVVAAKVSESEAHRVIKVWRALWVRMAGFGYCDAPRDPSFQFSNPAPPPRGAVWSEGEAVRLVKQAWRSGYHGLAALLAVAWDSQLSPIDARRLQARQRRQDGLGTWFATDRTKTGKTALATLSRRSTAVLDAYLAKLGAEPLGAAPIFRNRSGAPYSKDVVAKDFRVIRAKVFGKKETRTVADFRRSGTVEALAGKATAEDVSAKMANTLSQSNFLHATYAPTQLAAVRDADAARQRGRRRLREQNGAESRPPPAKKSPAAGRGDT
jgi:hypothetical protein